VRLVEAIVGKIHDRVKDSVGFFRGQAALHRPRDKLFAVSGQLLLLLFGDGAAQQVGIADGITGHVASHAQDLLLVDADAIGFLEDRLQRGVRILDRFFAMLALDIVGDELHRAGAIQ